MSPLEVHHTIRSITCPRRRSRRTKQPALPVTTRLLEAGQHVRVSIEGRELEGVVLRADERRVVLRSDLGTMIAPRSAVVA